MRVWEGRIERQADETEFHFVLNDHWKMDNRIPPRGWNLASYQAKRAAPVIPAAYAAWQTDYVEGGVAVHADTSSFDVPAGAAWVIATLYYQTASREYIDALAADNPGTLTAGGFNRGTLLQHAWQQTGRSAPVVMTRDAVAFADADADRLPDAWETLHGISAQGFNDDADSDGDNNWQELLAETDPTAGPADPTRPPVDVVLALDVSGSMSGLAPGSSIAKIDVLKDSVTLFIEAWRDYAVAGDRIGVVYFGDEAHASAVTPTLQPFAGAWSSVLSDVELQTAGGWTAMGAGMHVALDLLGRLDVLPADVSDPERAKHVVLFSNGRQNREPILAESRSWEDILAVRNRAAGDIPVTGGSNVVLGPFDEELILKGVTGHVFVHTIGIGVAADPGGTAWHDELAYFARIQDGKHVFITRAFELEGSFLESLVETLKGNTLEYVLEAEAELVAGRTSSFEIPVNQTASRFTVLISWSGTESVPPAVELRRPDGELEDLSGLRRGGRFFSTVTRYLDDPDEHPEQRGTWTVTLGLGPGGRDPQNDGEIRFVKQLPVRVHGLLDDTAFQYEFGSGRGQLRAGDPLRAYAIAREGGRRLRLADEVSVEIQGPERALGNLLADYDAKGDPDPGSDVAATAVDHKLHTAFQDPEWAERWRSFDRRQELNDRGENGDDLAGDGRFSAELMRPTVPGHYALTFRMKVRSGYGHQVVREEQRSMIVRLGPIDLDRTRVRQVEDAGVAWVELVPTDVYGNLLGPGYAASLDVRVGDTRLPAEDLLDGRYRAELPAGFGADDRLVIQLWDDTVHDGPVPERGPGDGFPGCVWILLLVLVIALTIAVIWWLKSR
jgi:hypothetical protein